MKKYIVIWVTRIEGEYSAYPSHKDTDEYKVFTDGDSIENFNSAQAFYEIKSQEAEVYSCNLCEVIESTDY